MKNLISLFCLYYIFFCVEYAYGSWNPWSGWTACYQPHIVEQRVRRRIRTCSSTCTDGLSRGHYYTCKTALFRLAKFPYTARTQCTTCTTQQYFDTKIEFTMVNVLWLVDKNFKIHLSAKRAANGQYDLNLWEDGPYSINDSPSLRSYIKNFDGTVSWDKSSTNGDAVIDYVTTKNVVSVNMETLTSNSGNLISIPIQSIVTANPQPDSQTYLSAGFSFWNSDLSQDEEARGESVFVIQDKRSVSALSSRSAGLDFQDLFKSETLYTRPSANFAMKPYIQIQQYTAQVRHVRVTAMVGQLFFKFTRMEPVITKRGNGYNDGWFSSIDRYIDVATGNYYSHMKYLDPSLGNVMHKIFGTYSAPPYVSYGTVYHTAISEVSYCARTDGDCDSNNHREIQSIRYKRAWQTDWMFKAHNDPVRIKHKLNGRCWTVSNDGTFVYLKSECKDVFVYQTDGRLYYSKSNKYVETVKNDKMSLGNKPGKYTLTGDMLKLSISWTRASCVEEDGTKIKELSDMPHENDCNSSENRVTMLPDYSQYYGKLNMKGILQASTTSGNILMVCEPKRYLTSKSGCFYSFNSGSKWTAITAVVTQIKFYYGDDGQYYGYCNAMKYHCHWNMQTNQITYIEQSVFESNYVKLSSITSLDVDGINMASTPSATSEDQNVALSSKGIYNLISSSWRQNYIWTN